MRAPASLPDAKPNPVACFVAVKVREEMFGNVLGYVLFYIYKAPDYARSPPPFMRGSAPGYARALSKTPPDMRGPAPEYAKPARNPKLTAGPYPAGRTRLCVVGNGMQSRERRTPRRPRLCVPQR